jgi:hypothetical protein
MNENDLGKLGWFRDKNDSNAFHSRLGETIQREAGKLVFIGLNGKKKPLKARLIGDAVKEVAGKK